jgi:hypothetical protein
MRWPGRRWPTRIVAATGGRPCSLEIESLADGLARAMLPGPRERGPAGDTAAAGSGQERDEPTRPA